MPMLCNRYSNDLFQHMMKNIMKFNRIIIIIYRYISFINLEMYHVHKTLLLNTYYKLRNAVLLNCICL